MGTARRRPAYEIISDVIDCIRWSALGSTHFFDRLMVGSLTYQGTVAGTYATNK